MDVKKRTINNDAAREVLESTESHFLDFKSKDISPAKLSKTISSFANTSGGEIFIGIEEIANAGGKKLEWRGFVDEEDGNPIFQVLQQIIPLGNSYVAEFIYNSSQNGILLHLTILKTQDVVPATDGRTYVRRSAQSLPLSDGIALERLRFDKGVKSFEDEIMPRVESSEITNSRTIIDFMLEIIPTGEPEDWLFKQRVISEGRPTVAGVLLFSDNPQSVLPKRSAIKVLRYQTKHDAERDFLVFDPLTVEGPLYSLIYDAVEEIKRIIEGIERAGPSGMEKISYPEEALHELLTNAILHRDYNNPSDVQVRIFDNRVEIESPGRLPGHVTVDNITKTQFARNPKIVRLINKFKNPPNKDVGEGINTAFEAMGKLRLKKPTIEELEGSVLVVLRHETLGSPEQIVMDYLKKENEITNSIGRDLTGIKSENTMKQVFYKLRESGVLEQVPKIKGRKPAWRKKIPEVEIPT